MSNIQCQTSNAVLARNEAQIFHMGSFFLNEFFLCQFCNILFTVRFIPNTAVYMSPVISYSDLQGEKQGLYIYIYYGRVKKFNVNASRYLHVLFYYFKSHFLFSAADRSLLVAAGHSHSLQQSPSTVCCPIFFYVFFVFFFFYNRIIF